jgi:hypothetical protein
MIEIVWELSGWNYYVETKYYHEITEQCIAAMMGWA